MKKPVTKKSIKNQYSKVLSIGYCNLSYLLDFENPFAYSTRVEGWACDYYNIDGVVISTGLSPIGRKVSFDLQKKYNDEARDISYNPNLSYEDKKSKVNELLKEFIGKVYI
jgi:hypothetical protein